MRDQKGRNYYKEEKVKVKNGGPKVERERMTDRERIKAKVGLTLASFPPLLHSFFQTIF